MPAFDIAGFRLAFPEFSNLVTYPDSQITFWSGIGEALFITDRWRWVYTYGLQLFVAHSIALAAQNNAQPGMNRAPGSTSGPISNKHVGSVSYAYDSSSVMEENAGEWNATSYGRTLIRLARMIGAGALQV